jgi:hypothetical protein
MHSVCFRDRIAAFPDHTTEIVGIGIAFGVIFYLIVLTGV